MILETFSDQERYITFFLNFTAPETLHFLATGLCNHTAQSKDLSICLAVLHLYIYDKSLLTLCQEKS